MANEGDGGMDYEKMRQIHDAEQAGQFLGDYYPPLWRRIFLKSVEEGFSEVQAFDLLKVYIHGNAGGKFQP